MFSFCFFFLLFFFFFVLVVLFKSIDVVVDGRVDDAFAVVVFAFSDFVLFFFFFFFGRFVAMKSVHVENSRIERQHSFWVVTCDVL